jgi:ectoine hydroxylase-related dioxygenase (phytanoyl-CoA dioxygenase family)
MLKEYIIKKKRVSEESIRDLFNNFVDMSLLLGHQSEYSSNNFTDKKFNDLLIDLRKQKPQIFSAIYNNFQNGLGILKFFHNNNFVEDVTEFMGAKENELLFLNCFLRMDPPFDMKNTLDWHVDHSTNKYVNNGCTIWCPLQDTDVNNGTIKVLLNSVNEEFINKNQECLDRFIKKYNVQEDICVKKKDILIFKNKLVHKSGFNKSDKIRFALLYHFEKIDPLTIK